MWPQLLAHFWKAIPILKGLDRPALHRPFVAEIKYLSYIGPQAGT